jgi:hypothetical protein
VSSIGRSAHSPFNSSSTLRMLSASTSPANRRFSCSTDKGSFRREERRLEDALHLLEVDRRLAVVFDDFGIGIHVQAIVSVPRSDLSFT